MRRDLDVARVQTRQLACPGRVGTAVSATLIAAQGCEPLPHQIITYNCEEADSLLTEECRQ